MASRRIAYVVPPIAAVLPSWIGGAAAAAAGLETGGSGVEVHGTDDMVAGNFLGLLPDGVTAVPNQFAGVNVTGTGAGTARIGGTDPASTNVLSGNRQCTLGDCQGFGAYVDV